MKLSLLVKQIETDFLKTLYPQPLKSNSKVCVDVFIQEGAKQRVQSYTGTLIAQHKAGLNSTITVRRISRGIQVERVFPVHSPDIKSIKLVPNQG